MDIQIDKNKVPTSSPRWIDILDRLMVNESFLVDDDKRNNVACVATQWFHSPDALPQRAGKKFKSTIKNQPEGKVRFWRAL